MTDPTPTPTETTAPADTKADQEKTKALVDSTTLGPVISAGAGIIAGVMGAGWAGIAALVLGSGALVFLVQYVIRWINSSTDHRDMNNAGADAGGTAVDIANQAGQVRHDLDDLEKNDPPTGPPK